MTVAMAARCGASPCSTASATTAWARAAAASGSRRKWWSKVANPRGLSLGVRIVQAYRKGEPLLRPLERLHRAAEEPQGQRPVHASAHAGIVASIHELVRPVPLR